MYNQGVTRSLTRTRLVPFGQACVLSALIVSLSWFLRASDLGSSTAGVKPLEAIGWKLFFDKILSGPGNFSCGSCHLPEKGYEGGVALAKGAHNDVLPRSTPTVVNLKEATAFFWDGRALSLEEQAKGPITSEIEMDLNLNEAEARIRADPAYRKAFAAAGADIITVHAEAGPHLDRSLQAIRALGCKAGVALNPATPAEAAFAVLDRVDLVLAMTVNPGFGGQSFLDYTLDKISAIRERIGSRPIRIEVDGGVTAETGARATAVGADALVAGTAVFQGGSEAAYSRNIAALRAAGQA